MFPKGKRKFSTEFLMVLLVKLHLVFDKIFLKNWNSQGIIDTMSSIIPYNGALLNHGA